MDRGRLLGAADVWRGGKVECPSSERDEYGSQDGVGAELVGRLSGVSVF